MISVITETAEKLSTSFAHKKLQKGLDFLDSYTEWVKNKPHWWQFKAYKVWKAAEPHWEIGE